MKRPPSEETRLVGVADRDVAGFRAFYERHAGRLALRTARRCDNRDLAAEAARDTFVAAWPKPQPVGGRSTFTALAVRELRRFIVNPIFLLAVVLTAWFTWDARSPITEIDAVIWVPAILLGGLGMMATFGLTRSMRESEPVLGVAPVGLPMRTAALCTVAVVPLLCGVLNLVAFLHFQPAGAPIYGAFDHSAQTAVLVEQVVIPALGGPLLGVALGRWVLFPGAGFMALLLIFGWENLATVPSVSHPDSLAATVLRLFAPFTFFTVDTNGAQMTTWRGSPWWFNGWQLALCAIAVLVALLRGAEGRVRVRVTRALQIVVVLALILLVLASVGGFSHAVDA
jgi:hypothetical protein